MSDWDRTYELPAKKYICGHCNSLVTSDFGYFDGRGQYIYICPCDKPTYFYSYIQIPGYTFGKDVEGIEEEGVKKLYNEARKCTSNQAYTATVLLCRKLLMHIAVEKGALEGKNFIEYVDYLANNHYIPPDGKTWVDHIRKKGNEANHEIKIMGQKDAEDLIAFTEMLLKFIYEFPSRINVNNSEE